MPNEFDGKNHDSEKYTQRMRDINALEDGHTADVKGVAFDGSNYFVVANDFRIAKYDTTPGFVSGWGSRGTGDEDFSQARSCDVLDGYLFVVDQANGKFIITDLAGNFELSVTTIGMTTPQGIRSDGEYLYLTSSSNLRIAKWSQIAQQWSKATFGLGNVATPAVFGQHTGNDAVWYTNSNEITARKKSDGTGLETRGGLGGAPQAFAGSVSELFLHLENTTTIKVYAAWAGMAFLRTISIGHDPRELYWHPDTSQLFSVDLNDNIIRTINITTGESIPLFTAKLVEQTNFSAYTLSTKISLGTPDGGVSVPAINGLSDNSARPVENHFLDMRNAIEALAPLFINSVTGNGFYAPGMNPESADNLYRVAMGNRTKYGATGGAQGDWTRDVGEMVGTPPYGIDFGEIFECTELLAAS